jgi:hypothetical protein
MTVRTSQYHPGHEIPEKNLFYRLAKRLWCHDFGAYRHSDMRGSAPAILRRSADAIPSPV